MKPAIRVENLSKLYHIGVLRRKKEQTLREAIVNTVTGPWRRFRQLSKSPSVPGMNGCLDPGMNASTADTIWALKDVSFEIEPGEVVGIIGQNGSGKSTLLKILSQITEPTTGRMELRGRLGSLLEVGTGFHPELSGRENVYLSGAILGMKKTQIDRRFDEIVAFAGVAKFIDTPVKRYSSGMYVRLAFAVAAHLDPDILLVDEALAVGDAAYQARCLDRMAEMARTGKTVVFVTHGLDLVQKLCRKAIHLDKGQIRDVGPAMQVVERYLAGQIEERQCRDFSVMPKSGEGYARFTDLQLVDKNGTVRTAHVSGEDLILRVEITADRDVDDATIDVNLSTLSGAIFASGWTDEVDFPVALRKGSQTFLCHFRNVRLRPGCRIAITLWLASQGEELDHVERAKIIDIVEGAETRRLLSSQPGIVIYNYSWSCDSHIDSKESCPV